MYGFQTDCLTQENQLVCFQEKSTSSALSISQFPIVLNIFLRTQVIFPVPFGRHICLIFLFDSHMAVIWFNIMSITSGGTRRQSHNKPPHLLALKNPSASPSLMFSEPEVEECFVALCSISLLWWVVIFCISLHFMQRKVSLISCEDYTYLWI